MEATAQMTQINVRVDAQLKKQAEDALRLAGTTTTEFVRAMLAKVACGVRSYEELMAVVEPPKEIEGQLPAVNPVVAEGWAIVDEFCHSIGYESAADVPKDTRSWDEVYEEAMIEHYQEKGWLQ